MIMGYSLFGDSQSLVYKTELHHPSYNKIDLSNMTLDEIFVDEDIAIPFTAEKNEGWNYRTVVNAKLQNSIEGGSVQANNFQISAIRFQRREIDEVEWQDIGEVEYRPNEQLLYEVMDKNMQNNFEYQYSLLPITQSVLGNRVVSESVTAEFSGIFLSDKNNNYSLIYDDINQTIENNISNSIVTPLNSKYPIVIDGNADYKSGSINGVFISTSKDKMNNGEMSIKMEKLSRDKTMKFLKNKKPKVLRQPSGETMLIRIVDNPQEDVYNINTGMSHINFNFVEIGGMDSETLKANDILLGIQEEF